MAADPGAVRAAREPLDLHLAAPTAAQPRRRHLSAGVALHSSIRKKPPLRRFAMAGGGSGIEGPGRFPGPAGHLGRGPELGRWRGGKGGVAGSKGLYQHNAGSHWLRASFCQAGGPARSAVGLRLTQRGPATTIALADSSTSISGPLQVKYAATITAADATSTAVSTTTTTTTTTRPVHGKYYYYYHHCCHYYYCCCYLYRCCCYYYY